MDESKQSLHENQKVLVIEDSEMDARNLRICFTQNEFRDYKLESNHSAGLRSLQEEEYTHVILTALDTTIKVKEFLEKAKTHAPDTVFILSSYEPNVDDVFEMIGMGIKGILAKPFTADSIVETILKASEDRKVKDLVASAQSRNEAISALVLDKLDKAAAILKEAPGAANASGVLKAFRGAMQPVTEVAERYTDGGMSKFQDSLISVSNSIAEANKEKEDNESEEAVEEHDESPLSVAQINARRRREADKKKS